MPIAFPKTIFRCGIPASSKIGRMAVLKKYRRYGVGAKLLQRAIATAKRLHPTKIYLHAQVAVSGFYEKFKFIPVGPIFDEAGIPHRKMVLGKAIGSRQQAIVGKKRS